MSIFAILVQIVLDCASAETSRAFHREVVGRQIVHADKAGSAVRGDAADFAVAIAGWAFNVDNHAMSPG